MQMPRVSIPDDAPPVLRASAVWPALMSRATLDYHDTLPASEDRLVERIATAEVVLNIRASSKFTERVFAACPHLRLISVWGTGTDHVDIAAAARHGVTVTNTPGVSAISVAEHALALLLAVARRIPQVDAATRRVAARPIHRASRQDLRRRRPGSHRPPVCPHRRRHRDACHRMDHAPQAAARRRIRGTRRPVPIERRGQHPPA